MTSLRGRLVRVDDFPAGDKNRLWMLYDDYLFKFLGILEKENVNYILGASPLQFESNSEIEFLQDHVIKGRVVMHGFDHGFSNTDWEWQNIKESWQYGGEFAFMPHEEISDKYDQCHEILSELKTYDEQHFIPPFNAINQQLLDVLHEKGVKYIHLNSLDYEAHNQFNLNFHGLEKLISNNARTYGNTEVVIEHLEDPSTITLHWIYDQNLPALKELARAVGRDDQQQTLWD